jgi:hypothetical protein
MKYLVIKNRYGFLPAGAYPILDEMAEAVVLATVLGTVTVAVSVAERHELVESPVAPTALPTENDFADAFRKFFADEPMVA